MLNTMTRPCSPLGSAMKYLLIGGGLLVAALVLAPVAIVPNGRR